MSTRELVVVADLDGTLVEGDGLDLLLRALGRRSRTRRIALTLITPIAWALMIVPSWRATAASLRLWAVTVGVAPATLDDAVDEIVQRTVPLARARPRSALAEIRDHVDDGARLVVVTAGTRPLAEATCRALGLDADIVAASWRPWCGGIGIDAWVSGRRKAEATTRLGTITMAYGDSITDLPMLRRAQAACLVAPGRWTRLAAKLLVPGVRVLSRVA
ncbi:HAD family hydrolase [Aeromicrobium phragmitis]|uniref:HAD family hydrolase n=1 Tax=Aeromicrobium phragmitis TaxID=2478914 RepID=UPI00140A95A9|nr:HAD family hydrolase [Aeromicrobium phragmitis]